MQTCTPSMLSHHTNLISSRLLLEHVELLHHAARALAVRERRHSCINEGAAEREQARHAGEHHNDEAQLHAKEIMSARRHV